MTPRNYDLAATTAEYFVFVVTTSYLLLLCYCYLVRFLVVRLLVAHYAGLLIKREVD